jgi:predicted acyl esterase
VRYENEWPLARTQWTRFHLDPSDRSLTRTVPAGSARLNYQAMGDGITFLTPPLAEAMEVTGPLAARLAISSSTTDADLFLVLRLFDPAGKEVVFVGTNDPRTPVGLGWLRASHRKIDPAQSLPHRPWHTHDEEWPLTPGEPVDLDIEIWPTCIVVPPGYRLGLTIRGRDYEYDGSDAALPHAPYPMKGVGPFTHTNPADRPPQVFAGTVTLHFSPDRAPYLLLPVIPAK